jgi:phosphoribosylglycinamide formyltransferase-1
VTQESSRIGIILSAGGNAFVSAARIASQLPIEFDVVTDRPCGAEDACRSIGFSVRRIEEKDNRAFSVAARDHFSNGETKAVLLHFSRLITPELFASIPCCNVHPALLPLFPGIAAVRRARNSGVRFLGATLHLVDEGTDTGPIIAQTVTPILLGADVQWCERASFLQKVLITSVFFEMLAAKKLTLTTSSFKFSGETSHSPRVHPTLADSTLIARFSALQTSLGFDIFP